MQTVSEKKILVALDGSKRSMETVRYISQTPSFCRMRVRLFHVLNAVPKTYWDLQREPSALSNAAELYAWDRQNRKNIAEFMDTCRSILIEKEVHPENIQTHVGERKKGIARDIIEEARKGYTAVVLGRRGMTRLQKLIIGSTALKLLNALSDVPLIFAGHKPPSPKVLLAFDGSENAYNAVDFACDHLTPGHHEVTIVSVVREDPGDFENSDPTRQIKGVPPLSPADLARKMEQAVERFYDHGFNNKSVSNRVVSNTHSRSGAIVEIAKKEDFGTIVVGRRGHSKVREFPLGSVSQKILTMAKGLTVWIVN